MWKVAACKHLQEAYFSAIDKEMAICHLAFPALGIHARNNAMRRKRPIEKPRFKSEK